MIMIFNEDLQDLHSWESSRSRISFESSTIIVEYDSVQQHVDLWWSLRISERISNNLEQFITIHCDSLPL